jgi:predicted AAA+ superfamily ATPase
VRQRASSPKLCVLNTALATSRAGVSPERLRADPERWGRLVETCVGAHLLNTADGVTVSWWREGHDEVDFVLQAGPHVTAIEVKTAFSAAPRGLTAFQRKFPRARAFVVGAGSGAIPLESFFARAAGDWVG